MYCMNCGQELPAKAKFCFNCGSKVEVTKSNKREIYGSNHPQLFTKEELSWKNSNNQATKPRISQEEVIHNKKVTHYSDKPTGNYSREIWEEWYNKLDEEGHEILRDRGEDPYDPWR